MMGYLHVRPVAGIEQELRQKFGQGDISQQTDFPSSLEGQGWVPLTAAIKQGNFLKVSAEKYGTRYEACFNIVKRALQEGRGSCEIRGGPLACVGTFVDVRTLDPKF